MVDRNHDNVVSFRSSRPSDEGQKRVVRKPLPRHARFRRWVWLIAMITFCLWSGTELVLQSLAVHEGKTALAQSEQEVQALKAEQKELQRDLRRLQNEEYLLELARKLGYALPGEEVVDLHLDEN